MKPTFFEWLKAIKNFILEIPIEISAFIVAPFLYFFVDKETGHLPKWLSWYDEPNYGAWGDKGWKQSHFQEPKNKTWWAITRWYWRNRINGYQTKVTGIKISDVNTSSIVVNGDKDATIKYNSSCLIRLETKDGKKYFGYYYTKVWCRKFYFRIYIGHKLMEFYNADTFKNTKKTYIESVFSIHPLRKVSSF